MLALTSLLHDTTDIINYQSLHHRIRDVLLSQRHVVPLPEVRNPGIIVYYRAVLIKSPEGNLLQRAQIFVVIWATGTVDSSLKVDHG